MQAGRVVPLYTPGSRPVTWDEQMQPGEYAVLFANRQPADLDPALGPAAVIFPALEDATRYAEAETIREPRLRCNVYGHDGMASPPVAVIAGAQGADTTFLSAKFRIRAGLGLLAAGLVLALVEWGSGDRLLWAGTVAARLGPAGAILLLTEAGVRLSERGRRSPRKQARG